MLVDGVVHPKSHRLVAGSVVEVELPEPTPGLTAGPVSVPVLHEDEHLLVVDKPAGLPVHPGAGERRPTLASQLLTLGAVGGDDPDRPGIVHRLDRDTSGTLVVARSDDGGATWAEPVRPRELRVCNRPLRAASRRW